jgi:phosphoribosyl 1,2-cyclic phosphodiesterase
MELIVLGSSSTGNGYLLRSAAGDVLIIETGIRLSKVKEALGFDLSHVHGALITHSHADHSGRVGEYLAAGVRCYASPETITEKDIVHHNFIAVTAKATFRAGPFTIMPFALVHDVTCYGYLIRHDECGQVCFITDTLYCRYRFPGLNQVIIEANYSDEILDANLSTGKTILQVRNRVVSSHMSLDTCRAFLRANDLRAVRNIVLIHLSSSNASADGFRDDIQRMTGKQTHIAEPGMTINLNLNPF